MPCKSWDHASLAPNMQAGKAHRAQSRNPRPMRQRGRRQKASSRQPTRGQGASRMGPLVRKSTPFLEKGSTTVTAGAAETVPASDADLEDAEGEADRRIEEGRCSCTRQM